MSDDEMAAKSFYQKVLENQAGVSISESVKEPEKISESTSKRNKKIKKKIRTSRKVTPIQSEERAKETPARPAEVNTGNTESQAPVMKGFPMLFSNNDLLHAIIGPISLMDRQ